MFPLYGGHQKGLTSKISGILEYLSMKHTSNMIGNMCSQIHTCVIFWFKCKIGTHSSYIASTSWVSTYSRVDIYLESFMEFSLLCCSLFL